MLEGLYTSPQGVWSCPVKGSSMCTIALSGTNDLGTIFLLPLQKHTLQASRPKDSFPASQVPCCCCRRRIYCVLRSPHVNKDSREHFEKRTHSRLLDIKNLTAQTIDELMQLDLPAGVDVEVKL